MIHYHYAVVYVNVLIIAIISSIYATPSNRLIDIACAKNSFLPLCNNRGVNFRARDAVMDSSNERYDGNFQRLSFHDDVDDPHARTQGGPVVPIVIPPTIPKNRLHSLMHRVMKDIPLSESDKDELRVLLPLTHGPSSDAIPVNKLPPEVVATCSADCTAPHCTLECKCAHTYPVVNRKCNPPANAELANVCQQWYARCTMFKPLEY
uniref:Kazal-like domain-containing protein n=1 Tax=Strongyloides papillosus TaxID=174720 RepID=A0A0N5BCY5_STREA